MGVFEHSGLQVVEFGMYHAPYDGFPVDALVTAVNGLYHQHGQNNPWRERTTAEWGWVLNRCNSIHYVAVEDATGMMQPDQWLAYTNVSWHGDSARPHQVRYFSNMIHEPTEPGRRAAQAILTVDAKKNVYTWGSRGVEYKQQIALDVPDLAQTLTGQGYMIEAGGNGQQQFATKKAYTHTG